MHTRTNEHTGADPGKIEREYDQPPIEHTITITTTTTATSHKSTSKGGGSSSGSSSSGGGKGKAKGKAMAKAAAASSPSQGLDQDQSLAARLGLEQAAPRGEVLVLLRRAMREAAAARDEEEGRPWLDTATQRQLLEAWQRGLKPGSLVDARDCDGKWYEAVVTAVGTRRPRVGEEAEEMEGEKEKGGGQGQDRIPGKGIVVRVSYRCWGPRFDEDIALDTLRVLPPYSVVPRWRDALAVGSHVEILSSASLAAAGGTLEHRTGGAAAAAAVPARHLPERKWWDAHVKTIDRRGRRALLSVDGRAGCARWVSVDGTEISDIGTHMKPLQNQNQGQNQQQPQPPPPLAPHKTPLPPTPRQLAAQAAAARGDLAALLSLISIEDAGALRLRYYRQKVGLVAAYRPDGPTKGEGCPLLTARREAGKPDVLVKERRLSGGASYADMRKAVLAHVVTELPDDLFQELLTAYW
jgi:hypothetical protein